MKKLARILAVLAAAATLGLGLASCDYWDTEWYKEGGDTSGSSSGSGSSSTTPQASRSTTYTGNLTVNGVAYSSLTVTGDTASGTAVFSGSSGSISGSYSRETAASAYALILNGRYIIVFPFGNIIVVFSNNGNAVTLYAGSAPASGGTFISFNGKTLVQLVPQANGQKTATTDQKVWYFIGTSDSTGLVGVLFPDGRHYKYNITYYVQDGKMYYTGDYIGIATIINATTVEDSGDTYVPGSVPTASNGYVTVTYD